MFERKATLFFILCFTAMMAHIVAVPILRADERPVVDVAQGRIVGTREVYYNLPVFAYRGIPYAKPPVDALRFMAPQPADPWTVDLDASTNPTPCPQITIGREDCLYLNVYTPEIDFNATTTPYPVMVWIHGGAFVFGTAEGYDKTYPLLRHDLIIVVLQYRLGVLGFFSTDDDVAPGNQGLMDQTMALQWVNDNIAAFGGDATQITIFGESAGSVSTHYQILTPSSSGLFSKAIMMSGNGFCPWALGREFYNTSRSMATRFGCPLEPSQDLVTCLQGVNFFLINSALPTFIEWNFQPFFFAPRVDGTYIPDHPATLVREGRFNKVPTIMGVVRDEGALESGEMFANPGIITKLTENFDENGPVSMQLYDDEDPINTATAAYDYYLGGINVTEETVDELTKMYTDRLFHVNLDWLVQEQASQTEVFMYQFNHRGEFSIADAFKAMGLNLTQADEWIVHGDDVQYLFEINNISSVNRTPEDKQISLIYSTLFTNFAKYGTPTPDTSLLGFLWPATDSVNLRLLSIALPSAMEDDSRAVVRQFWESLPLRINAILH